MALPMSRQQVCEGKMQRDDTKRLASISQAAIHANVHPDTIRRRISTGHLTGYRFGGRIIRVDLNEVDELLRPMHTTKRVSSGANVA
jgi:excisionase family DNA binding protein